MVGDPSCTSYCVGVGRGVCVVRGVRVGCPWRRFGVSASAVDLVTDVPSDVSLVAWVNSLARTEWMTVVGVYAVNSGAVYWVYDKASSDGCVVSWVGVASGKSVSV